MCLFVLLIFTNHINAIITITCPGSTPDTFTLQRPSNQADNSKIVEVRRKKKDIVITSITFEINQGWEMYFEENPYSFK